MSTIAVKPYIIADCLLTIGADNYEAHASKIELVPSITKVKFKGSTPSSVHNLTSTPEWVLNLTYAQDWETAAALSRYLHEHQGEAVECTFEPKKGGSTVTATITIEPGSIGGDVDAVAGSSVALGVTGQPVLEALTP